MAAGATDAAEAAAAQVPDDVPYGADPLTPEEQAAVVIAHACKGDWGPVFVYGSMLFPLSWSELLGKLPEMRSATLRGFERRRFSTGGFAGMFEKPGSSVVGMLVMGLLPKERLLLDAVVDDCFVLREVTVENTGDAEPRLVVTECGIANFNGRYVPDGTMEGKTCYRHEREEANGKFRTIFYEDEAWRFGVDYKGCFYTSDWDGRYPPSTEWVIDADGLTPLPVVTKEPVTVECSTYVVRESCLDAMEDGDWDFEEFSTDHLEGFAALCHDTQVWRDDAQLPDDILKELALARRRRQTGFEDGEEGEEGGAYVQEVTDHIDPEWVDTRLGVKFPTGIIRLSAIIRPEHIHDQTWVQPVTEALLGGERTPAEEMAHLEANEKVALGRKRKVRGMKYPQEPGPKEAGDLLEKLRDGQIRLYGSDVEPLVKSGLRPTTGTDFCVASVPYDRYDWYARVVGICASFRIGIAIVSEKAHEDVWFFVWKRNVDRMVKENKQLVVVTQLEKYGGPIDRPGIGKIDFVQSVQIKYLQQQGYKFIAVDIIDFCEDLQPLVTAASRDDFDTVEQLLMSQRSIVVPLANVADQSGRTAMHYVARNGPSERVIRMLLESGECINAAQWGCDEYGPGWTPLMHAVVYGPHRMVKVLLESNADAHAKNSFGKDAFALAAQGPPKNERMLSQCHWRCCSTCAKDEEEAPPPDGPLESGSMTYAQMHAAHCVICARFT